MRGGDRVEVAGEVEVDVLHRQDLAVAAAGAATLDAEHRTQRWLADRRGGADPDAIEALGEADGGGRLALAERRRGDRGDDDLPAVRAIGEALERLELDLGLVRPVELDLVGSSPSSAAISAIGPKRAACAISRLLGISCGSAVIPRPWSARRGGAARGAPSGRRW